MSASMRSQSSAETISRVVNVPSFGIGAKPWAPERGPRYGSYSPLALLLDDVDGAGRAEADDVREADLRAFDLAGAGLAAQVPDDLDDVGDAGRAERVALREQAAAGVDRDLAADLSSRLRRSSCRLRLRRRGRGSRSAGARRSRSSRAARPWSRSSGPMPAFSYASLAALRVSVLMSNIVGLRSRATGRT